MKSPKDRGTAPITLFCSFLPVALLLLSTCSREGPILAGVLLPRTGGDEDTAFSELLEQIDTPGQTGYGLIRINPQNIGRTG